MNGLELIYLTEKPSQKDVEKLIEESTKVGAVLANFYFDAQGRDRESLQNSLVDFVARIAKERGVLYCTGEIEKAIESEGMFSSYGEVRILAKSFADLHNVALAYGPISVEVLKPREIKLNLDEVHSVLLDASQSSQDFVKYITEKTMNLEDRAKYDEQLRRRAELGKALREKRDPAKQLP